MGLSSFLHARPQAKFLVGVVGDLYSASALLAGGLAAAAAANLAFAAGPGSSGVAGAGAAAGAGVGGAALAYFVVFWGLNGLVQVLRGKASLTCWI
jgi:sugar phosphate permease